MNKMIYNKETLRKYIGKDIEVNFKKNSKMTLSGKLKSLTNNSIKIHFEDYYFNILYKTIKSVEIYKRITNGISIKN